VERFMLDWVHRKVLLEPACVEPLPRVLARWVEFALSPRGLAPEHIAMVANMDSRRSTSKPQPTAGARGQPRRS
jgi:hypothetical protein